MRHANAGKTAALVVEARLRDHQHGIIEFDHVRPRFIVGPTMPQARAGFGTPVQEALLTRGKVLQVIGPPWTRFSPRCEGSEVWGMSL